MTNRWTTTLQVAFSRYFGRPETGRGANPAAGTSFARQSNLDIKSGEIIPPNDQRMLYQKGNMLWHMDSSFKAVSSLCSILTAREVPPEGGNTEFASTRLAYDSLSEEEKEKLEGLEVDHDIRFSRGLTGYEYDETRRKGSSLRGTNLCVPIRETAGNRFLSASMRWRSLVGMRLRAVPCWTI